MKTAFLAILVIFLSLPSLSLCKRKALDVKDDEVVQAAEFALKRLRSLSEYYTDLEQVRVVKAESEKGVFHFNWFLDVEYKVQGKTSSHEVMVMRHLDTNVFSFAIDEFPEVTLSEKDKDPYAHYTEEIKKLDATASKKKKGSAEPHSDL